MKKHSALWRTGIAVLLILSACNLPGGTPAGAPLPAPESLPPMPPAVIETIPPAGSQVPLNTSITFYFNQPMERASVEAALTVEPALAGRLTWSDDSIIVFTPDSALPPASTLTFTLGADARAANGQALAAPLTLAFRTADLLALVQTLPEDGSADVVATSAVVAAFNQPVVALGADASALPAAFTLEPLTDGRGEWLNTSTYIFYPDPSLAGGITYTARLNPSLAAISGGPLETAQGWSFTVGKPKVLSLEPDDTEPLALDAALTLTFNQPMDPVSVQANLTFTGPDGSPVRGRISWSAKNTVLTFYPSALLARNADYVLTISARAQGRGGTPIGRATSYSLHTYPGFYVQESKPGEGATMSYYASPVVTFSAPVQEDDAAGLVTVSPETPGMIVYADGTDLRINADFAPQTKYTVTISSDLKDRWGQSLGEDYTLHFTTAAVEPRLTFPQVGGDAYFLRADDPVFYVQAVNVSYVNLRFGAVPLETFLWLNASGNWEAKSNYTPEDASSWQQPIRHATVNQMEPVQIELPQGGGPLTPGIYHLTASAPESDSRPARDFLVASNVNLTLKTGATDALVWAVDLRTGAPVANAPVRLYHADGTLVASGVTDAQGLWHTDIPPRANQYESYYAILGQPGDDFFGMTGTEWDQDISPWNFGLSYYSQPAHTDVYFYTDRPIYRPGQTVSFRAVLRRAFDGQYSDAGLSSLPLLLDGPTGQTWGFDLPVSEFGTANGEFAIPADAQPGSYTFQNSDLDLYFSFSVAEYQKPAINLTVQFEPDEIQSGQPLQATVSARYFFDVPTAELPVEWTLYAAGDSFRLPNYRVGAFTDQWLNPERYWGYYGGFGEPVVSGQGMTASDGTLTIEIPADQLPEFGNRQTLTLEVTAQDESGQPVSARAALDLHPAAFYVGIRPDVWVGQAGSPIGFDVLTVDWAADPAGPRTLTAAFSSVTWQRQDYVSAYGDRTYRFTPVYTEISSADFATGADGQARLEFTPPSAGTYLLDISGGGAHSQTLVWVGGAGQAVWPNLPLNQVSLTPDRESYQAGQTAKIFIPNPFGEETLALVTTERGDIHGYEVLTLGPSGAVYSLPLTEADAPNIYVSVTLVGADAFRLGYVNLSVADPQRVLNVELTAAPQRAGPGEPVTFSLRVTDADGQPAQGEFSLAVADLAALALADPNSLQIVERYTQELPLGIGTALSLAADPLRGTYFFGGRGGGGGGGEAAPTVREDFPDTAYWNAQIVTDADGRASVSMTLPDSLTTWQVDVRGLTKDTRVGQAQMQVVATKDLLVRPVTPLFLVAGDHAEVGAVVHNNTADKLVVKVTLQAINFNLDKDSKQTQKVTIPAGGRMLVTWRGTAQDADSADLVFSAEAGSLSDASRPANGPLPIVRYVTPATFSTAGILSAPGSKLEAVSLPRSFDPSGGGLSVELSPSLAADILSGLDALEDPPATASNEYLLSYLLPNLEVYRALQSAGLEDAALRARADTKLQPALDRLASHQNYNDGGWAWYTAAAYQWDYNQPESDPYLTAYILFGLYRADQAGFEVSDDTFQRGREFLAKALIASTTAGSDPDLQAFIVFVLQETGGVNPYYLTGMFAKQERLNPWAQALLALAIEDAYPGSPEAATLITNLETTAIRSATGAHWESEARGWRFPSDTLVTTAMVSYALARRDPASPLLADAVRWLSINRSASGLWGTSYESAWVVLALNQFMVGTGGYAADYAFNATLNNLPLAQGQASGPGALTPVLATVPVANLLPDYPNALSINRGAGTGSLYYRAFLQVYQPVETVQPLDKGIRIERSYYPEDCGADCRAIHSIQLDNGTRLTVRLTLTLPHDAYYLRVEDFFPAGAGALNTSLKTSQQGEGSGTGVEVYDPSNPYADGWGWWYFSSPVIYDDHITWSAPFLPAGTYVLTYTLIPMHAGEFRVIPARAWLTFFPEVQGTSAGEIFEIKR
ncbi:MAG: hypothetical protein FD146_1590 [Anaerolineaceae bacterium]|nr:MAG: hypothetical protein FD146_1590 [Anaerolineaceae bacterium]